MDIEAAVWPGLGLNCSKPFEDKKDKGKDKGKFIQNSADGKDKDKGKGTQNMSMSIDMSIVAMSRSLRDLRLELKELWDLMQKKLRWKPIKTKMTEYLEMEEMH